MPSITIGDVTITRVQEWLDHFFYRVEFLPESSRETWEANRSWLEPEFWSPGTDDAWTCAQTFAVHSGDRTILVDTGIGNDKERPSVPPFSAFSGLHTNFLERLSEAGAAPGDVDLVVCTHLHPDHVGWNTQLVDGEWLPTFPHATYLLPRVDYNLLAVAVESAGQADGADPFGLLAAFRDSVVPVVEAGQAEFWEDKHTIDAALELVAAPGHTVGAAVVTIQSGGKYAVLAGDIVHHPMQVLEPDQLDILDADRQLATASRRRILGWAADNNAAFLVAHFPTDRAAHIARDDDGFMIDGWVQLT
jgi:glyoxylase-like metal-dependent hydrolase (beta-lactamase superfamily II)